VNGATSPAMERTWRFSREPSAIADAIKFAKLATCYCDPEVREAAALAVSELAENVVKYGAGGERHASATLAIGVERDTIRIRVKNAARTRNDATSVMSTISKIAASPSVSELYRARLRELFQNPALPRAQLGLLRIAFEGGFRLSCKYEDPFLEIVAERRCGEGK